MRLLFVLILGGFLGWIAGSLYPAPRAWLGWINLSAVEQHLSGSGERQTPAAPAQSGIGEQQQTPTAVAPPAAPAASTHPASRGAVGEQTLDQYRAWIHEARQTHPYADSEERMVALMMCESRGQAALVNPAGPNSGLFQYSSATWRGAWNTYRDQSILDPRAQISATALAWQRHMQGQWGGCYTQSH